MSSVETLFSEQEKLIIVRTIKEAEGKTSGEIKIHIELKCSLESSKKRAEEVFQKLKLNETKDRNGILIYLTLEDRKLVVLGDKGINDLVSDHYWHTILEEMRPHLQEQKIVDALCRGVFLIGEKLQHLFPFQSDDKNELSDDISLGSI